MTAILDFRSARLKLFLIYKSPQCFLPSLRSVSLSVQEKKRKWRPSCISDQNDFSYFWSTSHLNASYQVWSQLAFGFRRRREKQIFKMAAMAAAWNSNRQDFSYFWSTSHPNAPTKFGVNWPFGSEEKAKNRFSRWRPSLISNQNDFSYFWSTSHSDGSYQVSSQLPQGCRRRRLFKATADVWRLMPHDSQGTMDIDWPQ